ncbi:hypothetical protein [Neoroseomonas lacus]|uniref:DUF4276 family protein n=1 Tax=Neoroseomonas lacus TaxID=287609 RepID=A0A917KKV4_9PROT|nr:hypothetical protein [Neoroseomonas lacus]GGJ16761.1 hypothetical protein GCM10011320_25240 [Neoroseomonas lacus]
MSYLSWAALYEGATDSAYFEVMLYRFMEDIVRTQGTRPIDLPAVPAWTFKRTDVQHMAAEICAARDAFHILFVHADMGGRGLQNSVEQRSTSICVEAQRLCGFPLGRCITITPRHEVESWILADSGAVTAALGYTGSAESLGLPTNARAAERIIDPKALLAGAARQVRGRRRPFIAEELYSAIAQRQNFSELRHAVTFQEFEQRLILALRDLGYI